MPSLELEAHQLTINKLMRNETFTKFTEIVNGRIIIKLQVCVDSLVFDNSIEQTFLPSQHQKKCVFQEGFDICDVQSLELAQIYLFFIYVFPFLLKTTEVGPAMPSPDTTSTNSRRTSVSVEQTHIYSKAPSAAEARTSCPLHVCASP